MFVLLDLADIDIVFMLCSKASLTDLWEWVDYSSVLHCFALPKAFTQIKLKILWPGGMAMAYSAPRHLMCCAISARFSDPERGR